MMEYFKFDEFKCQCGKCGCTGEIDKTLQIWLDNIRAAVKKPVVVTSGIRCRQHNAAVGGSRTSQHISGHAADIKVKGIQPAILAIIARGCVPVGAHGIGIYKSWIHVDIYGRRQDYYWVD